MFGPLECKVQVTQQCAVKLMNGTIPKFWPFWLCCEEAGRPQDCQTCATTTKVDWNPINACLNDPNQFKAILVDALHATQAAHISEVPTVYINDKRATDSEMDNLRKTICDLYTGSKPPGCSSLYDQPMTKRARPAPVPAL